MMPAEARLFFCRVSGCLTEGRIFVSASGEEMVSINTRDTMGIRMLKEENIEVRHLKWSIWFVKWSRYGGQLWPYLSPKRIKGGVMVYALMFARTYKCSFYFYVGVWRLNESFPILPHCHGYSCTVPLGGAVDLQRGPSRPVTGRQVGEEDGLPGGAGGKRAKGWLVSDSGEEKAALEGRGVHG